MRILPCSTGEITGDDSASLLSSNHVRFIAYALAMHVIDSIMMIATNSMRRNSIIENNSNETRTVLRKVQRSDARRRSQESAAKRIFAKPEN
jgi:hypothetical protein